MRTLCTLLLAAAVLSVAALDGSGADWPRWRGPEQNGLSKETGLLKTWPAGGPKLVWTYDKAGNGYGSFAVVGGVVYTMGARGTDEYAIALENGKEKWATKIAPVWDFKGNNWSRGPNASPCVDGDLVFCLGSQGTLLCVNKADGKQVWKVDVRKGLNGDIVPGAGGPDKIGWGYCWSPFVDGDKLVILPGGEEGLFGALDKKSGKVLWRSKGVPDPATYSSPVQATIGGVKQYIAIVQTGVVGVSADDGTLLWRHKRDEEYPDVVCPPPVVLGDKVYVGIGYGAGADLLQVSGSGKKFAVKPVWSEKEIGNKQGGVVIIDGYAYGYHEERSWICQDVKDGSVKWRSKRDALKAGSLIGADGLLFVLAEDGEVGLLAASPAGYKQNGRFTLPKKAMDRKPRGGVWAHPVLSDGMLYLRDQEYVFCYKVK